MPCAADVSAAVRRRLPNRAQARGFRRVALAGASLAVSLALGAANPARAQQPPGTEQEKHLLKQQKELFEPRGAGDFDYQIRPGDTCLDVARKFFPNDPKALDRLHELNDLGPLPHELKPGTVMRVHTGPDARLTFLKPAVQTRPTKAPLWTPAQKGGNLFRLDQVNTLLGAGAEVTFRDASELQLDENALLVIYGPPSVARSAALGKSGGVELVQGDLSVRLAQLRGEKGKPPPPPKQIAIHTPAAVVSGPLKHGAVGVDAKSKMSRVSVFAGQTSVEAQGRKVEVAQGFGTRVEVGKKPEEPQKLPEAPPWKRGGEHAHLLRDVAEGATEALAWAQVEGGAVYRVEVARDPGFVDRVLDKTVPAPPAGEPVAQAAAGLAPGRYYERASAQNAAGLNGPPSAVRLLDVVAFQLPAAPAPAPIATASVPASAATIASAPVADSASGAAGPAPTVRPLQLVAPETAVTMLGPAEANLTLDGQPVAVPVIVRGLGRHELRVLAPVFAASPASEESAAGEQGAAAQGATGQGEGEVQIVELLAPPVVEPPRPPRPPLPARPPEEPHYAQPPDDALGLLSGRFANAAPLRAPWTPGAARLEARGQLLAHAAGGADALGALGLQAGGAIGRLTLDGVAQHASSPSGALFAATVGGQFVLEEGRSEPAWSGEPDAYRLVSPSTAWSLGIGVDVTIGPAGSAGATQKALSRGGLSVGLRRAALAVSTVQDLVTVDGGGLGWQGMLLGSLEVARTPGRSLFVLAEAQGLVVRSLPGNADSLDALSVAGGLDLRLDGPGFLPPLDLVATVRSGFFPGGRQAWGAFGGVLTAGFTFGAARY